jgi:hypothetical protein
VKIAAGNFLTFSLFTNDYSSISFIEFFNLRSVNCHAEYKLVGTKLSEIFSSDHSYLFLKTIFTRSLRSLVKIVLRNKYSYLRSKISGNFVPTRCITIDNSTRILSTNQIYEIGQYGPITLVFKKMPPKFSLFIDELL